MELSSDFFDSIGNAAVAPFAANQHPESVPEGPQPFTADAAVYFSQPAAALTPDVSGHIPMADPWMPQVSTGPTLVPASRTLYSRKHRLLTAPRQGTSPPPPPPPLTEAPSFRPTLSSTTSRSKSTSGTDSLFPAPPTQRAASSGFTEPWAESEPPRKKTKKKGRRKAAPDRTSPVATEAVEGVEGADKRNKFLERNRVAASKCRQKKKVWISDLQETKFGLESQHSQLQTEYDGLLREVGRMKGQLMAHANCNDPNIDSWIESEARRFVQSEKARYSLDCDENENAERGLGLLPPTPVDVELSRTPKSGGAGDINYDYMPDSLFEEDSQGSRGSKSRSKSPED